MNTLAKRTFLFLNFIVLLFFSQANQIFAAEEEVTGIASDLSSYDNVYVHCKMGGRAKVASEALINAGLDNIVCVGNGGMERWKEMGWPMQK